ncbi:MAG: hypothetical protein KBE04_04830 [Phycisphaerae bacterium]|nr:hypothetical protein [Phycisphaerae bacterium]
MNGKGRFCGHMAAVVCFLTVAAVVQARYSGGTGEPNDPYQIATAADLIALGETPEDYNKHFILTADIDLDPDLRGGRFFDGAVIESFAGVFDGNGHTISHATIRGYAPAGFFRSCDSGAEVKDLSVVEVNVAGSGSGILLGVGGLAGRNRGTLTRCYSSGTVSGTQAVGGLVGDNGSRGMVYQCHSRSVVGASGQGAGGLVGRNGATVTQCHSAGTVSGDDYHVGGLVGDNTGGVITESYSTAEVRGGKEVGGLVGFTSGTVNHCYSIGPVTDGQTIGGLVGYWYSFWGTVTASFWDKQASGLATSVGGTGKTTAQMQTAKTFLDAGWDFIGETANGTEDIWRIVEGQTYPLLSWQQYSGGSGEPNDPYQIATAADLIALGDEPNDYDKHFTMIADIDLAGYVFDRAVIAPDRLLGTWEYDGTPFTGVFDGNNKTIAHLKITGAGFLGLFGQLASGAEIKNLGVVDANVAVHSWGANVGCLVGLNDYAKVVACYSAGTVRGSRSVGGLVGGNKGTLTSSYSTATVHGDEQVGGLVGGTFDSTIAQCYSAGRVIGSSSVGGLLGYCGSAVTECYSTGTVSGNSSVGGLAGLIGYGTVTRCYSIGAVSGNSSVGGLVGSNSIAAVTQCFWDTQTSGQATSAGGTGKATAEMQMQSTFTDAGWDFVDETANGTEDIWWIDEGKDYPHLWWEAGDEVSP